MRKGVEGLAALAQDVLRQKPTGGAVFAFRGKRGQLPTFCIRFSLFDDCLSLAPAVREEGAGLAVQAWQGFNLHLHG
ncbi:MULTISPECIES: transposase [Rhizobium]|uniref:transposase n=1 Tax=Rhizobium TaxID=379 RepID=UPI002180BD02|nr:MULTISPECIES: transposase [Rhizobium]